MFCKTVAERTRPGQRQDVEEQGTTPPFPSSPNPTQPIPYYTPLTHPPPIRLHIPRLRPHRRNLRHHHNRPRLPRARRTPAALKVVDEFLAAHPRSSFANATSDTNPTLSYPELKDYIVKYQDPQQADSIMKIQKELDETKIVLHKTIESVLQRGEKIDDLVAKSDGLSAQMSFPPGWLPPAHVRQSDGADGLV
ncbi:Synaptobrevin-like protein [Lachnellula subtilissima]|uniref:Synaptobrevin-like protein n=1 Tax=Lachnellula subtilissima TaxID=602034 RepID=A0A8H8UE10_9HELO|nr:Synaptobrevin-like protein [Lachnellula subtilissima]